jgi:phosphoribosyl-ATP pyrophosphohydrolase/phosphoribosyl-AMP cyclohydrolase/histidinol dehydrogenase
MTPPMPLSANVKKKFESLTAFIPRQQNKSSLDMETTLPLPFLPSIDLGKSATESKEGLTRHQLAYLGCAHFAASNDTVDILLQFLQKHVSIEAYIDVRGIDYIEDIVSILDAGARKIFVKDSQLDGLKPYVDRVVTVYSAADTSIYTNGTLLELGEDSRPTLEKLVASKTSPIYLTSTKPDLESFFEFATKYSAVPIIPAASLTLEKGSKDQVSVPGLIAATWTSDRTDKLLPTVVTDERGVALGLVYSSEESLAESLKTGTGVYQSRRRGLWYKGATSGNTQELVRVSLDCDQDCLKFVVRQKGRGEDIAPPSR